jgi:4-amino-4-deoxy-L-arabinose transferase-like glycosyltransferase
MIHRSKKPVIWLAAVVVSVNAIVLFIVIPKLSHRLTSLYNQNLYADSYDQLASNLAEGNGYRLYPDTAKTLMREPGYPIFLAGIFLLFEKSFATVKFANMLMGLVAAWLMTRIARRLSTSTVLILIAPLLFLFHPGTLLAETRGGVELLFILLLTLFVLTVYRAIEGGSRRDYAASGAVLGLTVLVKSTPMLFPLVLLAYLLVLDRRANSRLAICLNVALMVMAMLLVMSPWIVRNYRLTGRFVPTASVLGVSAHAGQYICSHLSSDTEWVDLDREAARQRTTLARELGYRFKYVEDGYYQSFYSSDDEMKFSSYLLKRVVGEYQRSPRLFVSCVRSNLSNFWFAGKTRKATAINLVLQVPYLIFSVIGIVLAVRNGQVRAVAPLALFVTYYVAVHVPILAQARYSIPLIPFLSILACLTLAAVSKTLSGKAAA